ncbi:Peroxidase P7 [Hibiscus syriacus]|uniref:peroxidase n=1 Tax=Hibiscus syriacus TaxID=106335 RepID=A0A6A2ZIK1_HIBSY|nr:Peroxidase P7 [Hibiscus syriacus]
MISFRPTSMQPFDLSFKPSSVTPCNRPLVERGGSAPRFSGCDGSILLDDTAMFTGEKNAAPNQNSARGFEVIDTIKSNVETACSATVSCADIQALAARDGVVLLGGSSWQVVLGRRDARTASQSAANSQIRSPFANLPALISSFAAKGLNARARCPATGGDNNLAPLDSVPSPRFDNNYYHDLVAQRGLLHSDQELFNGEPQDALVQTYSNNAATFLADFTGTSGEIRRNCRVVN